MANPTLIVIDAAKTTGTTVSATQASASTNIPVNGIGKGPLAVQLVATNFVHVKLGSTSAMSASLSDFMVGSTPVNFVTKGVGWISYLADSSTASLGIGLIEAY